MAGALEGCFASAEQPMNLPKFRPLKATDCSATVLCPRTVQLLSHCLSITIPGPIELSVDDTADAD